MVEAQAEERNQRSLSDATSRFFRERAEIANHQILDGILRPVTRRLDDVVQEMPLPERGRIPQGNTEGWTTQDCISWANANPPNQDSPTVRFVAYKLAAAVGELESELAKAKESESVALAANELLTKELKHWQSNHATEVRRARILKERPDLPIDRIQAYEAWGEDLAELAVLREEVAATKKEVP